MSIFIPKGGRDRSARVIIPPQLVNRFRDLRAFTYECKTPQEAVHMIGVVFRECGEVVEEYEFEGIQHLVMPAFDAAKDALAAVLLHCKKNGIEDEAQKTAQALWAHIEQVAKETNGQSGSFALPEA